MPLRLGSALAVTLHIFGDLSRQLVLLWVPGAWLGQGQGAAVSHRLRGGGTRLPQPGRGLCEVKSGLCLPPACCDLEHPAEGSFCVSVCPAFREPQFFSSVKGVCSSSDC